MSNFCIGKQSTGYSVAACQASELGLVADQTYK
jgi:hypothetical protein